MMKELNVHIIPIFMCTIGTLMLIQKPNIGIKKQYRKFELLKEQHPDKSIQILTKQKLTNLGIQL